MSSHSKIWLIGSGPMAMEYVKVFKKLKKSFKVIGRGKKSSKLFTKITNCKVEIGGIDKSLSKNPAPKIAIVAVGVEQLFNVTKSLIYSGTKKILLEKPGALNFKQIQELNLIANKKKTKIYLAYNRRFFQSVIKIKKIIDKDGGLTSINFEFTEMSNLIKNLNTGKDVKKHWLIANSSHVIDLAFYLSGKPKIWKYWSQGRLDWHPSSSTFSGSGITEKGVIFSYFADWQAPGRWGLELMTKKNRLILRPMEKLQMINFKSKDLKFVKLNDNLDKKFKPGLFLQTKNFLEGKLSHFCKLSEQVRNIEIFSKIAGYK